MNTTPVIEKVRTHALREITNLRARAIRNHGSVANWLRRAGVAESTYYRWLARRTTPDAATIARLAQAAAK